MAKQPDNQNKANTPPPNETHAEQGKPNPPAAAPKPPTVSDPASNAPTAATPGVHGSMPGTVPGVPPAHGSPPGGPPNAAGSNPGRFDPMTASGGEPPQGSGRQSGQAAGPTVPAAVAGPRSGGQNPGGPAGPNQSRPGQGMSPQQAAEQQPGRPIPAGQPGQPPQPVQRQPRGVHFGKKSEKSPALMGAAAGDDITLSELTAEVRQAVEAVKAHDYWSAARIGGIIFSHIADAVNNAATARPTMGATAADGEQIAQDWAEFDAVCREWDQAKAAGVAMAPNARNLDWHRSGGPAAGTAPPMAAPGALAFDPTDIMRILELIQTAISLIQKFRKQ